MEGEERRVSFLSAGQRSRGTTNRSEANKTFLHQSQTSLISLLILLLNRTRERGKEGKTGRRKEGKNEAKLGRGEGNAGHWRQLELERKGKNGHNMYKKISAVRQL